MTSPSPLPVAFVSHGAPSLALDRAKGAELSAWSRGWPRPEALLVVSAHWLRTPATIGTPEARPLLHDFVGFPPELGRVTYPAPGAPGLARRLEELLDDVALDPERPWDHGVWVPLVHLFPEADVPVLQLSLPARLSDEELFELGRRLAPLRHEGVLLLASGGMVHDLRSLAPSDAAPAPEWARGFEGWVRDALDRGDTDALLELAERAPHHARAHPTREHLQPFFVALGAAAETPGPVTYPVEGFELGSLSRLCVQFG